MIAGLQLSGRYQLIEKLGAGGMGSVWRAQDLTLNADIAIKLLEPEFVESPEAVHRFRREAQAAAAIRSTHVVQIFDYGIDGDKPFIAMELLKGEDLEKRLAHVGSLGSELTARVLGQMARAIALAHDHGIVHRDLKPANIFLAREYDDEVTKVLDFGIARKPGGLAEIEGLQTKTGMVLGTPYYMSPEQASGQPVNHLTDIWSFGIIAFECITGKRVFQSETLGALFHAVCIAPMPVPSEVGVVPDDFDAWFARATARDMPLRFQSMREAADSLQLLAGRSSGNHRLELDTAAHGHGMAAPPQTTPAAFVAPPVTSVMDELELTAPPSSHSVPSLVKPKRVAKKFVAVALITLIAGALLLGWRWIHESSLAQAMATSTSSAAMVPTTISNGHVAQRTVDGVATSAAPVEDATAKKTEQLTPIDLKPSKASKGQQQANPRLAATAVPNSSELVTHSKSQSAATAASNKPPSTQTPFVGAKVDPRIGL